MNKRNLEKHLYLTRADVLKSAQKRPIHKLRWRDIRGPMSQLAHADIVCVSESGRCRIMKDRQGVYLDIPRDALGLVEASQITAHEH